MRVDNAALGVADVVWNLEDFYASADDEALARDQQRCEAMAEEVAVHYQGQVASLTAEELAELVKRLEEIDVLVARFQAYAYLRFVTQTGSSEASALLQRFEEFGARIQAKTLFFELEWNQVDDEQAETLLHAGALDRYRHHLQALRRYRPHQLSLAEERLLARIAPVGRSAWMALFDKVMGQARFGGEGRTEEEVLADLYRADRQKRRQAALDLTEGLERHLTVLTHVFNTMAGEKMIMDRLRRYPTWLSAINLANELRDDTVETLVETVRGRYDLVRRYYRLKRRLLGVEALYDYDRYAPLPGLPEDTVTWSQARDLVLEAFAGFSPRMSEIARRFFDKRWIHAPVLPGKRGGAFAHPCVPCVHPYVMVNFTGSLRDVETLAHELGHGVHQYLAADRGFYNSDTQLVLAETASVFAEMLVFKRLLDRIRDPAARRAFVCQKIESIFATVFRQVAMNRFEHAMHQARRSQGELGADELGRLWLATQEEMFGDSVRLTEGYRIWWAYIPHFLGTPGYVYSYAFGELLVLALYSRYQERPEAFVDRYLDLLAAGGSDTPYRLLEPFGVDLDDPEFWQDGLDLIQVMIESVEEG